MPLDDRSEQIDPKALTHLWAQVAADIRQQIADGNLSAGERLPNEIELAKLYGVARLTARRAIADLVSSGHLVVLRGRGTYVK